MIHCFAFKPKLLFQMDFKKDVCLPRLLIDGYPIKSCTLFNQHMTQSMCCKKKGTEINNFKTTADKLWILFLVSKMLLAKSPAII